VEKQTFTNWEAFIILDAPTDKSASIAEKYVRKNPKFHLKVNKKQVGVAANIWNGVKFAIPKPKEIIAWLDGDDLLRREALETVRRVYLKYPKTLITHGSFYRIDKKCRTKTSKPHKKDKPVRKQPWRASHLKTFKGVLWQYYQKDWLKDDNGNWLQAASDLAMMFPLIEIAGLDRVKFIRKVLYDWRYTSHKTRGHVQRRNMLMLRKRMPVKRRKI
jgi:glycosyltransferase involved in cell wall biosynthesis